MTRLLLDAARPLLLRLPRGAGKLYRWLGGYRPSACWSRHLSRTARGVDHGFLMRLKLDNLFERETYYLGRFYEWELQGVLQKFLRPGDTFIDVGANIGMVTLLAAARVGVQGRVLAFEPNPEAKSRLDEHIRINRLSNVQAFRSALGERLGKAILTAPDNYTSRSTLRTASQGTGTFEVEVTTLDSYLDLVPANRPVFLKTDAEGFDFSVLKGGRALLSRPEVVAFCEVNPTWLRELGQTAEDMFAYMEAFDFKACHPCLARVGLRRTLRMDPLDLPGPHQWYNACFLRGTSEVNT